MGSHLSGNRPNAVDRRQRIAVDDRPNMPLTLGELERDYWASSVSPADHLRACDTDLAVECCRLYSLYRRAVTSCELIPLDDVASKTAVRYLDAWQRSAKRLGLDPTARKEFAKHVVRVAPTESEPDIRFFGGAG